MNMYRRHGKRFLDLILTIPALVLLAPVMLVIAVLVRLRLGGPILFRQTRPGLHGQPFEIIKFRTMTDACDARGELLPDAQRMHPFGEWLRSTSLDELPELFLVVQGKLSLVGPRPLLMRYLPRYTEEQMRRHSVMPGVTGWAQINGRNAISWDQKFELDVWYADHCSLWLDLLILLQTAVTIARREGISAQGYATAPEFMGTERMQTLARPLPAVDVPSAPAEPMPSGVRTLPHYEPASSQ
jgi:sugar transferase EpsL